MTLSPDVVSASGKCQKCSRYTAVLKCRECGQLLCNLHFCDICRHCGKHCKCWQVPGAVYHPSRNEVPPR